MKTSTGSTKRSTTAMLGFLCALLPALSICVFVYVRSLGSLSAYHELPRWRLMFDALGWQYAAALLAMTVIFYLTFRFIGQIHAGSLTVGSLLALNIVISLSMEHSDLKELFLPGGVFCNFPILLGFTMLCGVAAEWIFALCERKKVDAAELAAPGKAGNFLLFLLAVIVIAGCWIPWLLFCYPGSITADSCSQIRSWLGMEQINASHSILCTIIYGSLFRFGLSLGDEGLGIFLCLIAQGVLNLTAMGLTAVAGYRHTKSKWWYCGIIAFFAILPTWQNAAQIVLKDVFHTGCCLLFYLQYLKCLREKDKKSLSNVIMLGICALLIVYTRSAAFCLAVISIAVLVIVYWKKNLIPYLCCLLAIIGLFVFSNQVLYPRLNVLEERESENYSLPFQQVALYCKTYQQEMSSSEIQTIDRTLDFEKIIAEYTPMNSEPVKATFHGSAQDHDEFWKLYRKMLYRHPGVFVKALLMGSFEHLNPWYKDVNLRVNMDTDTDLIHVQYKHADYLDSARYWLSWLKIPVLRVLIGTGLYMWLCLIALGFAARRGSKMAFLGLVPSLILFIGLFMSPVNGEIQYGYPMIASAPVIFPWVLYARNLGVKPVKRRSEATRQHAYMRFGTLLEEYSEKEKIVPVEVIEAEEVFTEEETEEQQPSDEAEPLRPGIGKRRRLPSQSGQHFITRYISIPRKPKTYLDILKVLAIYLVLWNHTPEGFELYNHVLDMPQHMLYLCASIFDKIAVPLFFMTSGALLLGREESWRTILTHRVRRFALILVAVSAVTYVYYFNGDANYSFADFALRLFTCRIRTPLWYLYSYLAFLLTLPFLRKLARCMRRADHIWLVCLFTLTQLLSVADFFLFHGEFYHSADFVLFTSHNYVVFSLCGFYIERVIKKENLNLETLALLSMLSILSIGTTYMLTQWRMAWFEEWTANNSQAFFNTFIAIPSITVFYAAKLVSVHRTHSTRAAAFWSLLSTGTFGAYLFERYWRDTAWPVYELFNQRLGSFASSLIHVAAACALGILATLAFKLVIGMIAALLRKLFKLPRNARKKDAVWVYSEPTDDISDLEEIEDMLGGAERNSRQNSK